MVFHKRLEYGSSGCQVPVMIRVPKSARGKRSVRKRVEDQMCAFDLLATVAGELLSEKRNVSTPDKLIETSFPGTPKGIVKEERNKEKQIKSEPYDQGSCNESTLVSEDSVGRQLSHQFVEQAHSLKAAFSGPASICLKSHEFDKDGSSGRSSNDGNNSRSRAPELIPWKCGTEEHSPGHSVSCEVDGEHVVKTVSQMDWQKTGDPTECNVPGTCPVGDPIEMDVKPTAIVSSDSSVEVPLSCNHIARDVSFSKSRVSMEHVDRDEEDDSSGCTPSAMASKAARVQRIGDSRVRKLLAMKYWKVASAASKDGELCNTTDAEMKPFFRSRKLCYTRQRSQRASFMRRKMHNYYPISSSGGGIKEERVPVSLKNRGLKREVSNSSANLHGASSSTTGDKPSCQKGDFQVQLSIKSFKVPELFIEIPENATVGSLKRTVMEAVTAILGGGLRVGVLLQGKKVRDDSRTLLQAGISHDDKIDSLGFMLEPNPTQAPPPVGSREHPHFLLPCDVVEPLNRIPPAGAVTSTLGPFSASPGPPLTSTVNCPESDHDSVHSPATALLQDNTTANSRALVAVPAMDVEALAVVPLRKSKRSELVQRRIRRPFSVSEVEALVQAVEKLGTGRWRDVKLRAFDNAKHRTYVDLKDKWKTLVHTAKISPQQRRGEPVPQELLDRVLAANAYWSQQQAKLQVKPPPAEGCLLL